MGLAKDVVLVVLALAVGGRVVAEVVVFAHVDVAYACDGQVFIPIYRHLVGTAVAAPTGDVGEPLLAAVAVGVDGNGGVVVAACGLRGFKDAVGYAPGVLEAFLPPEVG